MPRLNQNARRKASSAAMPRSPEDRPLAANNCCSRCLYNIPRGSMMIVLPGVSILLMGIITMVLTQTSDSWSAGTAQLALMLLVIGGVLTISGCIFWACMWCRYAPKTKTADPRSVSPGGAPVELVAVYHINQPPAYQVSSPGPSGVIQVA